MCLLFSGFLACALFGMVPKARAADSMVDRVQAIIRARLDRNPAATSLSCQGEMICGIQMLPLVYRDRKHLPLWIDASFRLEKAEALAEAIDRAGEDGLLPIDYHQDAIHELLAEICEQSSAAGPTSVSPELWADLDLILTDAYLLYGSHLAGGRVNPETLHADWKINTGAVDLSASLASAASTGDINAALKRLRPAHSGYTTLRNALAQLRGLAAANGWPVLDDSITIMPGDVSSAVGDLRRRLAVGGDLGPIGPDEDALFFDATLASAVKRFQQRNGLKADGIAGRNTIGMLNVAVEQRVRQVVVNLERWRWLPHDLGTLYIIVNTADFNLKAVENGRVALQMRVVVGRPARRSPVFSANMTYLVVNPYWNVPTSIAVEDILPELQKDVAYLAQRGIRVLQNWGLDAPEVDPATVDWHAYHANRFPFRLRQDPGPNNALGRIKFMFPNPFAVYLHDTPNRSLFKRVQRDFSSGCIRVEAPFVLADFVLAGDQRWTPDALTEAIENGETRTIRLKQPVSVHLLYMTAWADETGVIQFRRDIYDRDRELDRAIGQRRPNRPPDFVH
ncbi:L,D-transpeptidase family protein [Desulfosarcina sp.]|uniref:L,D-transpeptidase family protein n=1 Tax=Desulfosarcina sp. TaxID=2027861 RepID=UPI0029B9005F|nr:L,D-transpeptidase family protein [Desulfosarcina sp.]MDX2454445.1 L,D-transpeptidase family protein [Desulfosarcina sp.]MDX2492092.1 L,D-transpeptidase family protein [Desulfosarcina sp.]